jgi:hypothetical protein
MLITTRHQGLASQSSPHARASPVLGTRISCPQLRTNKPDAAIPRQISSRSQSGLPDVRQLADLITKDAVPTDEGGMLRIRESIHWHDVTTLVLVLLIAEAYNMEQLAGVLQVPVATVKSMAFKRKGLLQLSPGEVEDRVRKVAEIVEVRQDGPIAAARDPSHVWCATGLMHWPPGGRCYSPAYGSHSASSSVGDGEDCRDPEVWAACNLLRVGCSQRRGMHCPTVRWTEAV